MEIRKYRLTLEEARNIDLVSYLDSIGHQPEKIRGDNYWYLSPLRSEKTASFKVNRRLNRWYDHGTKNGGDLLNFVVLYHGISLGDFLRDPGNFRFPKSFPSTPANDRQEDKVIVTKTAEISSPALIRYIQGRAIATDVAQMYCEQVHYQVGSQNFYGVGFKNDAGGYEIRTPFSKTGSSPKSPKLLNNGSATLVVFEGLFDFLSYVMLHRQTGLPLPDVLVLNSAAFFNECLPVMFRYESVSLYLDNDTTGQNCSRQAMAFDEAQGEKRFTDESYRYAEVKDLNQWLVTNRPLVARDQPLK